MQQPSIEAEQEFHVGQTVELCATPCVMPCDPDCGCIDMVARNGHQGAVLNVQPSFCGANTYYRIDGIDWLVYGDELRAVQPPAHVTPFERPATSSEHTLIESVLGGEAVQS